MRDKIAINTLMTVLEKYDGRLRYEARNALSVWIYKRRLDVEWLPEVEVTRRRLAPLLVGKRSDVALPAGTPADVPFPDPAQQRLGVVVIFRPEFAFFTVAHGLFPRYIC